LHQWRAGAVGWVAEDRSDHIVVMTEQLHYLLS